MEDPTKAPCSTCLRVTRHEVLHQLSNHKSLYTETHAIIQCMGCQTVSLAERIDWKAEHPRQTKYFPSPIPRKKPRWVENSWLADKDQSLLGELMEEIYQAVSGGQYRLAAMGIRSLLEQLMIATVGDLRTFDLKMDAFQQGGFISSIQRGAMKETLEMGHAVTHRGFAPSEKELSKALDIVEGICAAIFEHKDAGTELSKLVPRRSPPAKQ